MKLTQASVLTLVLTQVFDSALAAPNVEARAAGVCGSGIYGEVVPWLQKYPVAMTWCSNHYPVPCTNKPKKRAVTTTATTSTSATVAAGAKKAPSSTTTTTRTSTTKVTSIASKIASSTTAPVDPYASAWSKCLAQVANTISTICSCIESPNQCPSSSTTTTTRTTKSSSSTSTTRSSSSTTKSSSTTTASTSKSSTTTSCSSTSKSTTTTTTSSSTSTASTTTSTPTTTSTTGLLTTTSSSTCQAAGASCFLNSVTVGTLVTVLDNCCVQGACATAASPTCNGNTSPTTVIITLIASTSSSTTTASTTTMSTTMSSTSSSTATTTSTTPQYPCNGGPTAAADGTTYTILPNMDFMGASDASNIITHYDGTASIGDCINYCEGNTACVAVDFYENDKQYGPAGRCFLLSNTAPGVQSMSSECAASRGPQTTSSSTSTTTATSTASTASSATTSSTISTTTSQATTMTTTATTTVAGTCRATATDSSFVTCNPAYGCHRSDYPVGGDGCIGCLMRGGICNDGNNYCVVSYAPGQTCNSDSDCYEGGFCFAQGNGVNLCGDNQTPLTCTANPAPSTSSTSTSTAATSVTTISSSSTTTTASITSTTSAACTSGPTNAPDNAQYSVMCNTNIFGDNGSGGNNRILAVGTAASLSACIAQCESYTPGGMGSCQALDWVESSGTCYLLSSTDQGSAAEGGTDAATRTATCTPFQTQFNSAYGGVYTVTCGYMYTVNTANLLQLKPNVDSTPACIQFCDQYYGAACAGVSYHNGVQDCYMLSSITPGGSYVADYDSAARAN